MSQPTPVNRPRLLTVKHVRDVSPHLRRVCLTSPELADYPFTCGGAHIKIMLPQPGQTHAVLPTPTPQGPRWEDPSQRPIMRTFTIRAFRREALELDIDFALHGDAGPASRFAMQVKPGDLLAISGPGGPDPMLQPARHYYMVGDLTSLPAISAMAEVMPADAQGHIALLVPYQEDVQDLSLPAGVTLRWFIGTPSRLNHWWRISPPCRCRSRRATSGSAVKRGWWCHCAVTSGAPWRWIALGSTQSPTGATARMKRPITTPVTM